MTFLHRQVGERLSRRRRDRLSPNTMHTITLMQISNDLLIPELPNLNDLNRWNHQRLLITDGCLSDPCADGCTCESVGEYDFRCKCPETSAAVVAPVYEPPRKSLYLCPSMHLYPLSSPLLLYYSLPPFLTPNLPTFLLSPYLPAFLPSLYSLSPPFPSLYLTLSLLPSPLSLSHTLTPPFPSLSLSLSLSLTLSIISPVDSPHIML